MSSHSSYPCRFCGLISYSLRECHFHEMSHINETDTRIENLSASQRELYKEIDDLDDSTFEPVDIADDLITTPTCSLCPNYNFSSAEALKQHMTVHEELSDIVKSMGETIFACALCYGYTFTSAEALKDHMKLHDDLSNIVKSIGPDALLSPDGTHDIDTVEMDVDDHDVDATPNSPSSTVDFTDIDDVEFMEVDDLVAAVQNPFQIGGGSVTDYDIKIIKEKRLKKMGAVDVTYRLTFPDDMFTKKKKMSEVQDILKQAFRTMIDKVKQDLHPDDIMRAAIHNQELDTPVFVPTRTASKMDADAMLESLMLVLNSNEDIPFDSSCVIDIGAIKYPRGGTKFSTIKDTLQCKRSIVQIRNTDNTCLIRAVLVGYAKSCIVSNQDYAKVKEQNPDKQPWENLITHGKCTLRYYKDICDHRKTCLSFLVDHLCRTIHIDVSRPLSYTCIPLLENYLSIGIYVVSSELNNEFSYVSSTQATDVTKVFVYHVDDHFHSIVNITGFFNTSYFCQHCLKPYQDRDKHACKDHCNVCCTHPCLMERQIECKDCHRTCRSKECFDRHKIDYEKGKSLCQKWHRCPTCHKTFKTDDVAPEKHVCGHYTCKSCQQYVAPDHLCFARSGMIESTENHIYLFADIEASQKDEMLQCDWGYLQQSEPNCRDCRDGTCPRCKICRHCFKSTCGQMKHTVVLAVTQTSCDDCEKKDLTPEARCNTCGDRCKICSKRDKKKQYIKPPCKDTCGHRERIFKTLEEFGEWLFSDKHTGYTVFFHNLSYDGSFLVQYLLSQNLRPSFIIYRGSKIQMFTVSHLHIRVIDSFNFLPMALAKLPKAFQLDSLAKGYFPHFFTSKENETYVGPYPPIETYGPDAMSIENRASFLSWYQDRINNGDVFDFQTEIVKYCRSDVDILRRACLKFKNLLLDVTGQNEGLQIDAYGSCSIASLCMRIFKQKCLEEIWRIRARDPEKGPDGDVWLEGKRCDGALNIKLNGVWMSYKDVEKSGLKLMTEEFVKSPIARPPPNGYHSRIKYSKKSIQWLELLRHRADRNGKVLDIQHALTGRGEFKVPGSHYSLDGYVAPDERHPGGVAYEFQGCRYHGCPECFKQTDSILNPNTGQTAGELLAITYRKIRELRSMGMKVVTIWEHQFDDMLAKDAETKAFVDELDIVGRLDPRDSLMGGRTNGCVLYKKMPTGTKGKYVDFTSLYPYVNKTCRYPVGHPQIVNRDFGDITQYFGLAKVKILPPRALFHPVLGYRSDGKLTFPLCRACVERQQQTPCTCSDDERAIIGTYCTPEINKAVEKGYKLLKIYEVYHWDETTQYDPNTKTGGLFAKYINMFLKIKQEASGRPDWVKTEADLEQYIRKYEEKEGIKLDPKNIEINSGLRSLAKLMLNSFWGKFGQRMNLTKTQFIHDSQAHQLFEQMADPTIEVVDFNIADDRHLMLSTKRKSDELCDPGHTNIFLATFTTCWARLKLYELLDLLQKRVLYWDTDSVIYTQTEGEIEPQVGDYLGELTNELDRGDWIVEFVCNGPKNYAYRTHKGNEVCKVKGFSLNYANSKILNMDSMRDAMFNIHDPSTGVYHTINSSKICRDKLHSEMFSREEIKTYSAVYTKRVIQPDLTTVPYGY